MDRSLGTRDSLGRRLLQFTGTAWLVLSLNFLLPRLMPGNPLMHLDDPQAMPKPLTAEQRERLMAYYGLDRPLGEQYVAYMTSLGRGDLGWSIRYSAPVWSVLLGRLRWTLLLVGVATALFVSLGIVLGGLSAWYRGTWLDGLLLTICGLGQSLPAFLVAMLLIRLFVVDLGWLPMGGARSGLHALLGPLEATVDVLRHAALPVVALVVTGVGQVYYLARNSALQTLGEGYLAVARSKGLGTRLLLFRHAMPNALLPVLHLVAMRLGALVMGAVIIESAFSYPGIGSAIVEASIHRDYPLLQGAFAIVMLSVMGANLAADGLQRLLDPRLRRA
ncbi:MAG: ABC transporter permease [Chloroflexi bacterium]|nr:ABC transporter permease [Chloroflexota bacterium]